MKKCLLAIAMVLALNMNVDAAAQKLIQCQWFPR